LILRSVSASGTAASEISMSTQNASIGQERRLCLHRRSDPLDGLIVRLRQRAAVRGKEAREAMQEAIPGLLSWPRPSFFHFNRRCRPLGDRTFLQRGIARDSLLHPGLKVACAGEGRNRFRALKLLERQCAPLQHTVFRHDLLLPFLSCKLERPAIIPQARSSRTAQV